MRAIMLSGAAVLALGSTLALAQQRPADLLPPGFSQPAPSPTPSPSPTPPSARITLGPAAR